MTPPQGRQAFKPQELLIHRLEGHPPRAFGGRPLDQRYGSVREALQSLTNAKR